MNILKALGLTLLLMSTPALAAQQVKIISGQNWPSAQTPPLLFDAPHVNGAVLIPGLAENAHIGPVQITNAYRTIETFAGAVLKNVVIEGLIANGIEREGIRLRGSVENVTIRDFKLTHVTPPNTLPADLPEGIHVESGRNIVIENGIISGFQMTAGATAYWNGDGIATEGGVDGVTIRNVKADNNTDAGFDIKSFNTYMDNVAASGNKRNFRFWNGGTVGTMTTGDIVSRGGSGAGAGLWLKGNTTRPVISITNLIVRMKTAGTIISIEDGPVDLRINNCDIQAPVGSVLIKAEKAVGMKITLGPSCKL